jgi:myo-inositol-1(or 4)-monophosphatase
MVATLQFIEELALETGKLLNSYFHLSGMDADVKSDHTVVTEADLAADQHIRQAIQTAYPEDQILTEENTQEKIDPAKPLWIVDPLDGTTNFTLGLHTWGVSIARLAEGMPTSAGLYFPQFDELYSAEAGHGAFLNHQPLTVQPLRQNMPTAFFTCSSASLRRYKVNLPYKFRLMGAATYDFCLVARGAAIAGLQAKVKIWDIAAGWLVLEEAGGVATLFPKGKPFPYFSDQQDPEKSFPTLIAANPKIAAIARKAIQKR